MQSPPFPCHLVPLRPKCPTQHPIIKHSQLNPPSVRATKFHTQTNDRLWNPPTLLNNWGRCVKLNNQFQLVLRLRTAGGVLLLSLYAFMLWAGNIYFFWNSTNTNTVTITNTSTSKNNHKHKQNTNTVTNTSTNTSTITNTNTSTNNHNNHRNQTITNTNTVTSTITITRTSKTQKQSKTQAQTQTQVQTQSQ